MHCILSSHSSPNVHTHTDRNTIARLNMSTRTLMRRFVWRERVKKLRLSITYYNPKPKHTLNFSKKPPLYSHSLSIHHAYYKLKKSVIIITFGQKARTSIRKTKMKHPRVSLKKRIRILYAYRKSVSAKALRGVYKRKKESQSKRDKSPVIYGREARTRKIRHIRD